MTATTTRATLPEPPYEELRKLADAVPFVYLVIRRQDGRGHWAMLPPQPNYRTAELTDGTFETFLFQRHQVGGVFRVDVLDEETHQTLLVPSYRTSVDAPNAGNPIGTQRDMFGNRAGRTGSTAPNFQGPAAPQTYGAPMYGPQDFTSQRSDEVAMLGWNQTAQEKAALEQKLERLRERSEKAIAEEKERNRKLELEMRDIQGAHREAISELRTEMLMKMSENKTPPPKTDYTPVVAALVPVVIALIESTSSRAAANLSVQQKSSEMQWGMLSAALTGKKDDGGGQVKMLETFMPLVLQAMDEKSPSKQADLLATMSENNMAMLSLVTSALRDMMPEQSDDPLTSILFKAMEGVEQIAQAAGQRNGPAQPPIRQMTGGTPPNGARRPGLTPQSTPREIAQAVHDAAPPEFRTPQWLAIFENIHNNDLPAVVVAERIAVLLDRLHDTQEVPPDFAAVIEQSDGLPSAVLRTFLQRLPIQQFNPARVEEICRAFDSQFVEGTSEEEAVEGADRDDTPFGNVWQT